MAQEFLPLCDVLFNIISMAAYFCDIVFDLLLVYTLFAEGKGAWFGITLTLVLVSLLVSQITSLKWYLLRNSGNLSDLSLVLTVHMLQAGVLWRYFRLFVPVELALVKQEVRDLCLLRLLHAFCQAAPMLLIQLYLIWLRPGPSSVTDLHLVSVMLSLFNVCWALASFSKNVRRRNIHRLVLTWLGVICQFFWRLGTISSRVIALTTYATLYQSWVFVVISLHWLTMFLWLISPKNVFHGEAMYWHKKIGFSALIAFVYIFCYINLQEVNARPKMMAFYLTMFLENALLVGIWMGLRPDNRWFHYPAFCVVLGGFFLGLGFMFLYYRFFHIRLLNPAFFLPGKSPEGNFYTENPMVVNNYSIAENGGHMAEANNSHSAYKSKSSAVFPSLAMAMYSNGVSSIPGVFNCRLNPALKRKKKKPSSFIPPPKPLLSAGPTHPFWKKLPMRVTQGNSDHESSVGSRVNIQQKLQEKKQQQLQELKEIQEEIKQGKLKPLDMSEKGTLKQQPIPPTKKRPWIKLDGEGGYQPLRARSPEILLAPEVYYEPPRSDLSSEDLDSQVSLPRSYTLPRYHRRSRRLPPPSNNSSDGDVDSADEIHLPSRPYLLAFKKPSTISFPETQL